MLFILFSSLVLLYACNTQQEISQIRRVHRHSIRCGPGRGLAGEQEAEWSAERIQRKSQCFVPGGFRRFVHTSRTTGIIWQGSDFRCMLLRGGWKYNNVHKKQKGVAQTPGPIQKQYMRAPFLSWSEACLKKHYANISETIADIHAVWLPQSVSEAQGHVFHDVKCYYMYYLRILFIS